MADDDAALSGLTLPIPFRGLAEALRAWSGRGTLWSLLAGPDAAERQWHPRDIEARAHRVLFEQITPIVRKWPTRLADWLERLPAETWREHTLTQACSSGTLWPDTRRFGWPPRTFASRVSHRSPDTLLTTTLKWTVTELLRIAENASAVDPTVVAPVEAQLRSITELSLLPLLDGVEGVVPSRTDITAMQREGRPWNLVASVADRLRSLTEASVFELARDLILPIEELRWRLFHLGVLGELLLVLRDHGCRIVSRRPLSSSWRAGPAYEIRDPEGRVWDLWFEAAACWSYYGVRSPYAAVSSAVPGAGRALGADLMLVRPHESALLIECKYSRDPSVVARGGYEQALAYATETATELASKVLAVVIAPEVVILDLVSTRICAGTIAFANVTHLSAIVRSFFDSRLLTHC